VYSDLNINNNISLGRELRWLSRNSVLTEFLTNNSYAITQSKKLFGLNAWNADYLSGNLWAATRTNNSNSLEAINFLNVFQKTNYPTLKNNLFKDFNKPVSFSTSSLQNLNFIENSRGWLTHKFFFTNQNFLNFITTNKGFNQDFTNNPIPMDKSIFFLNSYVHLFNISLLNNINFFSSSIWHLKPKTNSSSLFGQKSLNPIHNIFVDTNNLDLLLNSDLFFFIEY
jgi:hypothetical protein